MLQIYSEHITHSGKKRKKIKIKKKMMMIIIIIIIIILKGIATGSTIKYTK